ncbi:hypothetical protein N8947_00605 [Candidatus Pelagibacter sp.]|nr:hypothetical protein [Candidatus Pelagibacter sp.]
MKKLLSIIILSLLFSGNVYAEDNAWKIKDKYMKPECLANDTANDLYLWESFDNYQEYYEKYIGIKDFDQWKDEKFKQFVYNIGLYLNKEIPLNDKFAPTWNGDWNNNEGILSITMQVADCLSDEPITKIEVDGRDYSYTVVENINLKEAKTLAPNINQDFISIKSIITSGNTSAIFGILDVEGKLIMVPLKILNTW